MVLGRVVLRPRSYNFLPLAGADERHRGLVVVAKRLGVVAMRQFVVVRVFVVGIDQVRAFLLLPARDTCAADVVAACFCLLLPR